MIDTFCRGLELTFKSFEFSARLVKRISTKITFTQPYSSKETISVFSIRIRPTTMLLPPNHYRGFWKRCVRYAYYTGYIDRSGERKHANKILHYTRETGTYRASELPRLRCVKRQNVYRNAIHRYMHTCIVFHGILYSFCDFRISYGPQYCLPVYCRRVITTAFTIRRAIF